MNPLSHPSLRQKLVRLTAGAVLVAILATLAAMAVYEVTTFRPRVLAYNQYQARLLAQVLVPALEFDDARTAEKILRVLRVDPSMQAGAVYYADGSRLVEYRVNPAFAPLPDTVPAQPDRFEGQEILASAEIRSEDRVIGRICLRAAPPPWGYRIQRYGLILALVTGVVLVLSVVLSWSIRRQITDPLQQLADTARRVGRDRNLTLRVPESDEAEIGALARSFNEMLEALRASDRALREGEARLTRQNAGLAEIARMEDPGPDQLEPTLARTSAIIARALLVNRVSIWLFTEDRAAIHCSGVHPAGAYPAGQSIRRADFPRFFAALDSGAVIDAADAPADARTAEFAAADPSAVRVGAMLDVPIRWRGAVAGVICNEHLAGSRPWQADEIAFAAATADHIALLLEQRESQRAGSDLRESEDRFRTFISQARDAIFTLDVEGRIESVNEAARTITGWDLGTWLGQRFQRVLLPEDVPLAEQSFAEVIAGRSPPVFELRIRTRSGGLVALEFSVSPRIRNGQVVGLLGIGRDVTERRQEAESKARLEDQLRQTEKMRAIGNLAGGIAHDFNNILTAIIGNAALAESDLARDHPVRDYVAQVLMASHRAKDLVNQILVFSRRQEQKRLPTNLCEVVSESMKLLRPVLPSSIEIRTALEDRIPLIQADGTQLHQIIVNLATNAAHAMEEHGGRLDIRVHYESIGPEEARRNPQLRPGRFLRLTMADTGTGMTEETRQRLFEPFFTTKAPGKGTGLGLAMVHGIVQQHDGAIEVQSEPGKGTTFHVFFPVIAIDGTRPDSSPSVPVLPTGKGERVLLVDDEQMVVSVARAVLTRAGYQVAAFINPAEAQRAFREAPGSFDLVLTDLTMPVLKGSRLAANLRELRPNIPIIIMTGFDGGPDGVAIRDDGLLGPLQKPFSSESLLKIVNQALGKGR